MSAFSRSLALGAAAFCLAAVPPGIAQDDTTGVLDIETIEDIDEQIDRDAEEAPNTDLWEDYQRYRGDGDPDREYRTSGERVNFGANAVVDAGERIVTSAQFLIDSESTLREAVQKMIAARGKKG